MLFFSFSRMWVIVKQRHAIARQIVRLHGNRSVTTGHKVVEFFDLVAWNAGKNIGEPGLWIDTVEFCHIDQSMALLTGANVCFWLFATDSPCPSYFRCPSSKRHSNGDVGFRAV